ncbi:MAG: hypothetical protein ACK4WD_04745 [Flavobacteriales bacterium]|jgi:hypothetical protein
MRKIAYTLLLVVAAVAAINVAQAQTLVSNPQIICLGATNEPYQVDYLEGGGAGTPGSTYAWTVSTGTAVITTNQGPSGSSNRILINWSATPVGLYTISVVETNNGCPGPPITLNVQIIEITATATASPILCNGGTTTVTVTGSGGTAPYTGTGTFTVGAGSYTYTVTDTNGCSDDVTIVVTEPTPLVASSPGGQVECNGGTTDIVVNATGGTAPYTGTGTFNVGAGTYTYTVTDANGCTSNVVVTVTENSLLTASATATPIACNGDQSTITVTASGGTGPYTGTGTFNEGAGTYTYTVSDQNGCTATTSVTITEPAPLVIAVNDEEICEGESAVLTATGAVTYVWTPSGGLSATTGASVTANPTTTTTYTVTGTDANGCTDSEDATVTVNPTPTTSPIFHD